MAAKEGYGSQEKTFEVEGETERRYLSNTQTRQCGALSGSLCPRPSAKTRPDVAGEQ
jgi:hypothetical protein